MPPVIQETKTTPEAEIEAFNQDWKAFLDKWGDKFAQNVYHELAVATTLGDEEVILPNVSTSKNRVWQPIAVSTQVIWVRRSDDAV